MNDKKFMQLALEEAKKAYERGDLPIGPLAEGHFWYPK